MPKYENCATVQNDHDVISGCFNNRDARSKDNKYATNKPPCANRHPDFANLYVFLFFKRKADVAKTKTTVKGSADLIANRETNWTKQAAGYAAAQPDALLPRSAPPEMLKKQ